VDGLPETGTFAGVARSNKTGTFAGVARSNKTGTITGVARSNKSGTFAATPTYRIPISRSGPLPGQPSWPTPLPRWSGWSTPGPSAICRARATWPRLAWAA